jgi:transcriptional regulator with XRE-family HTH domain
MAPRCAMADLGDIVAINVRRLRHGKDWTQEELADRVGLSARYVAQIERAQASMTVTVLGRVVPQLARGLLIDGRMTAQEMPLTRSFGRRDHDPFA